MGEYASNSNKSKELAENEQAKKIEKVVQGNTRVKKKSDVRKLFDVFVPEDTLSVKNYILHDVVIPSIKNAISSVVDIVLFGEVRRSRKKGDGTSRASYGSYYESERDRRREYAAPKPRNVFGYDMIEYDTRGDAERVLAAMDDALERYGYVSVLDIYDLSDISDVPHSADKYGWTDLTGTRVSRQRNGSYIIDIPRRPLPFD